MVGHGSFMRMIAIVRLAQKSTEVKSFSRYNGRIVNIRKSCPMKLQSRRKNHPDSGQQKPNSL